MNIVVIGAGGHVGLPFSLVCADAGFNVYGYDKNSKRNWELNNGIMPFVEEDGEKSLRYHVRQNLLFGNSLPDGKVDIVVIMVGTPVDGEGNPRIDDILSVCDELNNWGSFIDHEPEIVLRSTVAPGVTSVVANELNIHNDKVMFVPERVAQGVGIKETKQFPAIIGYYNVNNATNDKTKLMFETITGQKTISVSWKEAEIGKLMTNMYRYINIAFANEIDMIADHHKVDSHRIINAFNKDYPRLNMMKPGPNVGGPCLFKDGKFLTLNIPYGDLISTAFLINEGMPGYHFNKILQDVPGVRNILICGASFKAGSDDTRNSLSFKFAKLCKLHGIEYDFYDPHVIEYSFMPKEMIDYDVAIIMTPHKEFKQLFQDQKPLLKTYDPWKLL